MGAHFSTFAIIGGVALALYLSRIALYYWYAQTSSPPVVEIRTMLEPSTPQGPRPLPWDADAASAPQLVANPIAAASARGGNRSGAPAAIVRAMSAISTAATTMSCTQSPAELPALQAALRDLVDAWPPAVPANVCVEGTASLLLLLTAPVVVGDAPTLEALLSALCFVVGSPDARALFGAHGGIHVLLAALHAPPTQQVAVRAANERLERAIALGGAPSSTIRLFRTPGFDLLAARSYVRLLVALSRNAESRAALAAAGVAPALITLLVGPLAGNAAFVCDSAICLARLANEASVAAGIIACGGIGVVLAIIQHGALGVRSDADAHATLALHGGAADAAVDVLRGPMRCEHAAAAGSCALLAALAAADGATVVARGGAAAVVDVLRSPLANDVATASAAVGALESMTRSRGTATAVRALHAAPLLLGLRAAYAASAPALSDTCTAVLANITAAAPELPPPPPARSLPGPPPPPPRAFE